MVGEAGGEMGVVVLDGDERRIPSRNGQAASGLACRVTRRAHTVDG